MCESEYDQIYPAALLIIGFPKGIAEKWIQESLCDFHFIPVYDCYWLQRSNVLCFDKQHILYCTQLMNHWTLNFIRNDTVKKTHESIKAVFDFLQCIFELCA